MKTKQITVSVKRTIQTDQYESSTVDIVEVVELDDDDDADQVRADTYASVTRFAKKAIDNEARKYTGTKDTRAKTLKRRNDD